MKNKTCNIDTLTYDQQLELALERSLEEQKLPQQSIHEEQKNKYRGKDFKAKSGVDKLNQTPNPKLTSIEEFIEIEEDLQSISRQQSLSYYARDNGNQQVIWLSKGRTYGKDTEDILELYSKNRRKLHINTGIHGDEKGRYWQDQKLFIEDFQKIFAFKGNQFSFHIVSQDSPPIFPKNIDVLNAWCFSFEYFLKKGNQKEKTLIRENLDEKIEAPKNNELTLLKLSYEYRIRQNPGEYELQQNYLEQAKAFSLSKEEIYKIYEFFVEVGCQNFEILKERALFINDFNHAKIIEKLTAFLDCRNHPLYDNSFDSNIEQLIKQIGYQTLIEYFTKITSFKSYIYKGEIEMIFKKVSDSLSSLKSAEQCLKEEQIQFSDESNEDKKARLYSIQQSKSLLLRKFAQVHFLKEDYELAIQYCNDILSQNSKDKLALKIKGVCLIQTGQKDEAIVIFNQIHGLYGQDWETSIYLAYLLGITPKLDLIDKKNGDFRQILDCQKGQLASQLLKQTGKAVSAIFNR